jgi:hypothetical protein
LACTFTGPACADQGTRGPITRQLSRAQTREAVEQSVYLLLGNINEFDRLSD